MNAPARFLAIGALAAAAFLASCGDEPPPPQPTPTPAPSPTAAPLPPEVTLIRESSENAGDLKSYRYTLEVTGSVLTAPISLEGEFVAPDRGYVRGSVQGAQTEQLVAGSAVYGKSPSGAWEPRPTPPPDAATGAIVSLDTFAAAANPLAGFSSLLGYAGSVQDAGEETLRGVAVRRYDFKVDPDRVSEGQADEIVETTGEEIPELGSGTVWLDPEARQVHRFIVRLNLDAWVVFERLRVLHSLGGVTNAPTPTPVPPGDMTIEMSAWDHDSAAITVPDAPPTPTPDPHASPTPTRVGVPVSP